MFVALFGRLDLRGKRRRLTIASIVVVVAGAAVAIATAVPDSGDSGRSDALRSKSSARNGKIAFVRGSHVFVVAENGTALTRVRTDDTGVASWWLPTWAPDGRRIAVRTELVVGEGTGSLGSSITVIGEKGTWRGSIDSQVWVDGGFGWSPDGRQIVFVGDDGLDNGKDLYVVPVGRGKRWQLHVLGKGSLESPAWSPDGRWICFERADGIFRVGPHGNRLRRISSSGASPKWSPDSRRIVFSDRTGIFSINPNGSGRTRLTRASGDRTPVWSPDGRAIAFERNGALWVMENNGSHQRLVAKDAATPDWQRLP